MIKNYRMNVTLTKILSTIFLKLVDFNNAVFISLIYFLSISLFLNHVGDCISYYKITKYIYILTVLPFNYVIICTFDNFSLQSFDKLWSTHIADLKVILCQDQTHLEIVCYRFCLNLTKL